MYEKVKESNNEIADLEENNKPFSNFIIKEIKKDGNCFYRAISYTKE